MQHTPGSLVFGIFGNYVLGVPGRVVTGLRGNLSFPFGGPLVFAGIRPTRPTVENEVGQQKPLVNAGPSHSSHQKTDRNVLSDPIRHCLTSLKAALNGNGV